MKKVRTFKNPKNLKYLFVRYSDFKGNTNVR